MKRNKHGKLWIKTLGWIILLVSLAACTAAPPDAVPLPATLPAEPAYVDPAQPIAVRVEDLLSRMTLEEKIGQMTQVSKDSIRAKDVTLYAIGAILSAGGGAPANNSVAGWAEMVNGFQEAALATRLSIPLIYGVDAVHGHGNLSGATIFPHQVGLGATRNPDLLYRIGQATADEMLATGIPWNFAPVVAAPLDIRWGRTYEAYSEDPALVTEMALAYMDGLQSVPEGEAAFPGQRIRVLATPKHYLGDGGTAWGTSTTDQYSLDQGDMRLEENLVRAWFLPPYQAVVDQGARSIMPSYSSWQGEKMHASSYWLTDVLRGELGFAGFLISDLNAINQIDENFYQAVVKSINAGVDMSMISSDYKGFISVMTRAVEAGDIQPERVDEAVRRILTVKFELGLFDRPFADPELASVVGSDAHRELARQAVRESLVLLKNEGDVLPLAKDLETIFVAGLGADNIGIQSGGWTIRWQGAFGPIQPGTTFLQGIQALVSDQTRVEYDASGEFEGRADAAIVVVGEMPYAEGQGDRADLHLSEKEIEMIERVRAVSDRLIVVIVSGRPLIITEQLPLADAWVAAWLPGTEGAGVADVLFGDFPFTGRLPFTWPRSMDQIPIHLHNAAEMTECAGPLFSLGYAAGPDSPDPLPASDCE